MEHRTVLLAETVENLRPRSGGVYVDCTLGGGGHTALILERSAPKGIVIGIDQDRTVLGQTAGKLATYRSQGRVHLVHANFDHLAAIVYGLDYTEIDGIIFDLGFSSFQMDDPERGFSFRADAPLDMRMDTTAAMTAADLVNSASEEELTRIIREYGEERWAGRIAGEIVARRGARPIKTTAELTEIILAAYPRRNKDGTHPARRTFQAIRIAVNRELERLEDTLSQAISLLRPGGRIGVISFHSLEDRIVKQYFKREATECICPPGLPICQCGHERILKIITNKPIVPSQEEVTANPRARSAKLRVAEKVSPVFGNEGQEG